MGFEFDRREDLLLRYSREDQDHILYWLRRAYFIDLTSFAYAAALERAKRHNDELMLEALEDDTGALQLLSWMLDYPEKVRARLRT